MGGPVEIGDAQPAGMSQYQPINASTLSFQQAACVAVTNQSLSGHPLIDGYQTVVGDIILLTAQSTASQNGLWWIGYASWQRATATPSLSVIRGMMISVMNGTSYSGSIWVLSTPSAGIVVGTSSQTWINSSSSGFSIPADSAIVYVQTNGSDSNSGASPEESVLTITKALSLLPVDGGVIDVGCGSFSVASTGWCDSCTFNGTTTVADTNATNAYLGAYVFSTPSSPIGTSVKILTVTPGTGFTVDTAPGSGTAVCFITQPAIVLPPGVIIRGKGSSWTNGGNVYGTWNNTSVIQDTGTGVTVWIADTENISNNLVTARYGLDNISVWGNNANLFGVVQLNSFWFFETHNYDISFHGMAGILVANNTNNLKFLNGVISNNGTSAGGPAFVRTAFGGACVTGGLLNLGGTNQAAISVDNFFISTNYGIGMGGLSGGNWRSIGSFAAGIALSNGNLNNTQTTSATGGGNGVHIGVGAWLSSTAGGMSSASNVWFEANQSTQAQAATTGNVLFISCRFNNPGTFAVWIANATTGGNGPTLITCNSSSASVATVSCNAFVEPNFNWIGCVSTDPLWFYVATFGTGAGNYWPVSVPVSVAPQTASLLAGNVYYNLAGTTAGAVQTVQAESSTYYKRVLIYLNGYENTSGLSQTVTFPTAFANTPLILSQPGSFGATASTTTLTLPNSMVSPVTGWAIVEGF